MQRCYQRKDHDSGFQPYLGTILRTLSFCFQPILPNNAVCEICNKGDGAALSVSGTTDEKLEDQIMECRICFEIQHPSCLKQASPEISHPGVIDEDLPSSWECARCCEEGKEGQGKVRNFLFVVHLWSQLFFSLICCKQRHYDTQMCVGIKRLEAPGTEFDSLTVFLNHNLEGKDK